LTWPPGAVSGAVWTGNDYDIPVRVFHPTLPMIRPAFFAGRGIPVFGYDHFNLHFRGALNHRIEVFHLEPQQNAVPIRSILRIPDGSMVMFYLEIVELKHELAVRKQALVFRASVITSAIQ
jgi:hypothetical protein